MKSQFCVACLLVAQVIATTSIHAAEPARLNFNRARDGLELSWPATQRLAGERLSGANGFQQQITHDQPYSYVIEASGDLGQWTPWLTNLQGAVLVTNPSAPADRRFYRTVLSSP